MTYSRNRLSGKKPALHMTNSTPKPETPASENSGGSGSRDRYSGRCFRKGRTQVWAGRCLNSLSVRVLCCRERVRAYGQKRLQHPSPCAPWPECEGYKSYGLGTGGAPAAGLLYGSFLQGNGRGRVVSSVSWSLAHVMF